MKILKRIAGREAIRDVVHTVSYFTKRYPARTAIVVVFTLITSLVELVSVATVMPILSLATQSASDNTMLLKAFALIEYVGLPPTFSILFMVFIVTMIVKAGLLLVLGLYVDNSTVVMTNDMRTEVVRGLENISWSYITRSPHGVIVNLIAQEIAIVVGQFASVQILIVTIVLSAIYLYLGLLAAPAAFFAMAVLGGIGAMIARPFLQTSRIAGKGQIDQMRHITGELSQGMQAYKAFKAMAREKKLLSKIDQASKSYTREILKNNRAKRYLEASQHIILALGLAGVVFMSYGVLGYSLAEIGFTVVIMIRIHQSSSQLFAIVQKIVSYKYALVKVDEMIGEFGRQREVSSGGAAPNYPAQIRFDQVSFNYEEKQVLRSADFVIPASGMAAIVGESGAGKTTIVDLLCRFYRPTSGRILIGDQDLADIDIEKWRRKLGYVTQEPNLLNDTIRANVAAFDQSISDENVIDALKAAGAWDFVCRLPDGLNSQIGVSGGRISGGERQRVAIARALAQDPELLVLDEPTAAIDAEAERALIETLCELKRRIVIVAISHQPAVAAAADVVYRIQDGRVVAGPGATDVKELTSVD